MSKRNLNIIIIFSNINIIFGLTQSSSKFSNNDAIKDIQQSIFTINNNLRNIQQLVVANKTPAINKDLVYVYGIKQE